MTDPFFAEVRDALARDEAEYKKITRQLQRDRRRDERVLAMVKERQASARAAAAWAFTAPYNLRHIDGPAHQKRYKKMLALFMAADEKVTPPVT